jgi:selenocysteine-specific elongation factor
VLAGVEVAVVDPPTRRDRRDDRLGGGVPSAPDRIRALAVWLADHPFQAPSRDQLDGWALTSRDLADAVDRAEILRLGGVVLAGDVLGRAETVVRALVQPFTVGEASRGMGTSRRVAVPLLERLDATMVTRRLPDGRREVRQPQAGPQRVRP